MSYGSAHCKTIGAVTVTYGGNEGCLEGPDTVTEALLLVFANGLHRFIPGEQLIFSGVGSIDKTVVNTAHDLGKPSTVRPQTHGIAVTFLFSKGDLAADAGDAYNGIDKAEDLFNLFNGYHLAKVILLHLPGNNSAYDALDQSWCFPEHFKTLICPHKAVRVGDKLLDELAPMDIAQEIIGIVFGLQVPLLSLAMFHAKFTHFHTTQNRSCNHS